MKTPCCSLSASHPVAGIVAVLVLVGLALTPLRSQGTDSSGAGEVSVGIVFSGDWVHTDYHPNWGSDHNFFPAVYEDTRPEWRLDHGSLALDAFMGVRVTTLLSTEARIGFTFFGQGWPTYFPELDLLLKVELLSTSSLRMYVISGSFLHRNNNLINPNRWGIEGGVGIDLPVLPPVEVIFQKPFDPLTTVSWPSQNGGRIATPIHHWLWRIGLAISVWTLRD